MFKNECGSKNMEILNKEVIEATRKKLDEEMKVKVTLLLFAQEPSRLIVPKETFLENVLKASSSEGQKISREDLIPQMIS